MPGEKDEGEEQQGVKRQGRTRAWKYDVQGRRDLARRYRFLVACTDRLNVINTAPFATRFTHRCRFLVAARGGEAGGGEAEGRERGGEYILCGAVAPPPLLTPLTHSCS